jgi:hydroxymethylbilane synthase
MAGLQRLGLVGSLSVQPLEVEVMMPAVGQGVLVLETRPGVDLAALDHGPTRLAAETERAFLAAFGTGCRLPIGAYADGNRLRARVVSPDGQREIALAVDGQEAAVGAELAERFMALGARSLIEE